MAHTKAQRDQNPLCGAKRRDGGLCRLFAGQGTSHKGIGRCKLHGGATQSHEKHAVKRELQRRMVAESTLGAPEEITALGALLDELYCSSGHVAWLRRQIRDMSQADLATVEGMAVMNLYNGERDRKARVARMAIDSGVDEARIRVMERQCQLLGEALSRACDTAGLSASMRKRVGAALRDELASVNQQAEGAGLGLPG